MAESTLSMTYNDLLSAVGHYLGYGRNTAYLADTASPKTETSDWDTSQTADVEDCVKSGLRQFYNPPILPNMRTQHEWSFLKPTTSLTVSTDYSTGTIAINNGSATVTLTDGTWPSWAATNGTLVVDDVEYSIATRTSNSEIVLNSAWSLTSISGESYVLVHNGVFVLPDNFGGMNGQIFTFVPDEASHGVRIISEEQLRLLVQNNDTTGTPVYATIRPVSTTGVSGQRYEAIFYPRPDEAYVLYYKYQILPNALTSSLIYPLGGMPHSETVLQSCLAIAEQRIEEEEGLHTRKYYERLETSVSYDLNMSVPTNLGYNADGSDGERRLTRIPTVSLDGQTL